MIELRILSIKSSMMILPFDVSNWAEGLLLKDRTDLGLVNLPGTSRKGARKLLH